MEKDTGETVDVPLDKLSAADVQFATGKKVPKTIEGKVITVVDGDTIIVLDDVNTSHRIRLDVPQRTPVLVKLFPLNTYILLIKLVDQRLLRLGSVVLPTFRCIDTFYLDDRWINKEMVQDGWAWHYLEYNDDERLATAQIVAKTRRAGLWGDTAPPVPPWLFRHPDKLAEYNARVAAEEDAKRPPQAQSRSVGSYWLNTSAGVRHNLRCRLVSQHQERSIMWAE